MARNWRVDTLRGCILVLMTLGHFPNRMARFTEYTFGYASAPDGFVFLSGLVSAWVYLRIAEKRGDDAMYSKVLRPSGQIYVTHLVLFTIGILIALSSGAQGPSRWDRCCCIKVVLTRFFPCTACSWRSLPLVLKRFTKGRAWVVGVISASLWIEALFGWGAIHRSLPGSIWERLMYAPGRRTSS